MSQCKGPNKNDGNNDVIIYKIPLLRNDKIVFCIVAL